MSEPLDPPDRRPPPRRKRFLWLGALTLLSLCLLGWGWYTYLSLSSTRQIEEAVAETDRLDPGWRQEELEATRPNISDEENAALCVLEVKRLLPSPWPTPRPVSTPSSDGASVGTGSTRTILDDLATLPPEVQLTAAQIGELREDLHKAAAARAEARKLARLPRGRYAFSWPLTLFPAAFPGQDARAATRVLGMDAALRAQEGDANGALAAARAMVNAGRSIGNEPDTMCQLARLACQAFAVGNLERTLAQGQPSPPMLAALQEALQEEAAEPLLLISLRGERARLHRMFEAVRSGEIQPSQVAAVSGWQATAVNLGGGTYLRRAHAPCLRYLNEAVEIAKLPPERQRPEWQRLEAKARELPLLARMWAPTFTRTAGAFQRNQALLRAACVGPALERYRCAKGQWPDSLASLVTAGLLGEMPADPYDGKPLRYRRLTDGVVVYAIGPDGKDDGGTLNRQNPTATGSDIGFRLWDVPQRRRPPPSPSAGGR
jgi:hypothetical protein